MTVTPPAGSTAVFPVLDTMRAVASIGVVLTHVSFQAGLYGEDLFGTALARLDVGVPIFFVLSGFLLSRPYLVRARLGLGPPSLAKYAWKRLLRIAPVYVVVVVGALTLLPENRGSSCAVWLQNLTLTAVYGEASLPQGLTQMWSLAAEVAFYVALPFLMLSALGRSRTRHPAWQFWTVMAALVIANWTWSVSSANGRSGLEPDQLEWLPTYLSWFTVGMGIAFVHTSAQYDEGASRLTATLVTIGRLPGSCWAGAAALFVVACTPVAGPSLLFLPTAQQALTKNVLYAAIAGLLVLPGVFAPASTKFARAMSHPALRHIGHISYSLFCCHLIVLSLVARQLHVKLFTGDWLVLLVLTLGIALVVSELLYRLVERPFQRLRNIRGGRKKADAASSASASATHS